MKYKIDNSDYFCMDYTVYDSETLTKTDTHASSTGEYLVQRVTEMSEEEMLAFAHNVYVKHLEKMNSEIQKIQAKYAEKIKDIRDFEQAVRERKG